MKPPYSEDVMEHVLRQLKTNLREEVVWEEMKQAPVKSLARLFFSHLGSKTRIIGKSGPRVGFALA